VFSKLLSLLDESRRDLVRKMGFGALLTLKLHNLSPEFAYWLVTRVDGAKGVFYGGGDMEFSLDPIQFNCVLGLPMGTQPVPSLNANLDTRHRDIADHIVQMYGDSGGISVQKAWEFAVGMRDGQGKAVGSIVPIVTREEEYEFRIAFMIVILELVLCPSTDGFTLAGRLLPAASVFYLDHLNVVPRQWCFMPRVAVWSQSDVDALIEADKKAGVGVRDQDTGLKDTHSGGTSGGSVGGVVVSPALGGTQTIRPATIPTATIPTQLFGVPSPVGFAQAFGSARGFGTRGFGFPPPSTSVSPVLASDPINPITPGPSSTVTSDVLGFMAPSSSDCSVLPKSVTALQTKVQSPAQSPAQKAVITAEILKGVPGLRSSRKSRTDMEKKLVTFIKECQGNSKDEGPELIEFDGLCLRKYQMYRMVAMDEYAGIEYVKVASKMYTSRWKAKLGAGRGRSVMLEPGFGVKVVVPVLHMYFTLPPHTRWYCVALSMKDKRIWVLDPTSDEPLSEHGRLISHM
ncbi:hypothetical protein SOVF_157570, partial [Spinacia oleracea]